MNERKLGRFGGNYRTEKPLKSSFFRLLGKIYQTLKAGSLNHLKNLEDAKKTKFRCWSRHILTLKVAKMLLFIFTRRIGGVEAMSEGKKCTKCKIWKAFSEFYKKTSSKDGFQSQCKECRKEYEAANKEQIKEYYQQNKERIKEYQREHKERIKERKKEYYQQNKERIKEQKKEYYQQNKERIIEQSKEYYQQNKERIIERNKEYNQQNKERKKEYMKEYQRNWREVNREYYREYQRERRQNDPAYRLRHLVSEAVRNALSNNNSSKEGSSTWNALPYTPQQLKEHLEAQFEKGMSWGNYGEWHVDHIYPQSKLPYESMSEENFKIVWSLKNLRPLWAAENISKGNQIIEGAEELLLEIKEDLNNTV